jgi:hypothetical protein
MLTRDEEEKLRATAKELRQKFAGSPEYMRVAQKLEQAANTGDCVLAAEAATCLITHTLGAPPIKPKRRFISG